jgi:hypothetical protein
MNKLNEASLNFPIIILIEVRPKFYSKSPVKSVSDASNLIFFTLQYSLARIYRMQPIDFFALLLQGIIFET